MRLTELYLLYTFQTAAMNDIPIFLTQTLRDLSEAAAIITADCRILFANKPFEELLRVDPGERERCEALRGLDLTVRGGEARSPQTIALPGRRHKVGVFVYILNTKDRDPAYCIRIQHDEKQDDSRRGPLNPYVDEEKFRTEKLAPEFKELVGEDIQFRKALVIAQRAAKSNISVLIIGESGTGKEILARAIHRTSHRKNKPLVDVNCAAIPDSLIESELFGYEKGAFTGARTEGRKGYFDEAHEGTILLDEIGDASLQVQSKLLRVLESGNFKRVGGTRNIKVDVRIISSTNRDLSHLIAQKTFREDLYFRLNAFTIYLPPLRERRADIPLLVDFFLKTAGEESKRRWKFSKTSLDILNAYHWPGNVRELKGVVSYAVNMTGSPVIAPSSLPNFLFTNDTPVEQLPPPSMEYAPERTYNLTEAVRNLERQLIEEVLARSENKSAAIKMLGISRRTFYLKLKEYRL